MIGTGEGFVKIQCMRSSCSKPRFINGNLKPEEVEPCPFCGSNDFEFADLLQLGIGSVQIKTKEDAAS